jgi:hypothetical protein
MLMLVSSIGGLRQIIVDASSFKFYEWESEKAEKVEILLGSFNLFMCRVAESQWNWVA